ncbi:MAG: hypothetical protein RLZZ342_247 [Candidatus Parcubacteria bacterium]|jgi:hypothetical protein
MSGDPTQQELRDRHRILRLYAALLLTQYSAGHLNLDEDKTKERIHRLAAALEKTHRAVADSLGIIHMTAAMIPVLIAQGKLDGEVQSVHGPSGTGSTVTKDNAVFAEFIIETLLEYDPARFSAKSETMCELLSRVIDMTGLSTKFVVDVINEVYTDAFKRSLVVSESSLIAAADAKTIPESVGATEKPRIRAVS